MVNLLHNSWAILGQMSPYLLLGFFISGILSVFISPEWVQKHLGSSSGKFLSVIKSTLLGIPLPLCSCGVIPVAASLRNSGASKGATTSFLLATPQTGLDSIFASYGLLGPVFGIIRPIAALITGIVGGTIVTLFDEDINTKTVQQTSDIDANSSFLTKTKNAMKYAFITLPSEISKALVVGIIIAALISTFLNKDFFTAYISNYYLSLLVMLVVGIPLYVCSTSSIPIALGFINMGASPGAALVFLISGPATNAATISVLWKLLGKKTTIIYLSTVAFGSLGAGLFLDYVYSALKTTEYASMLHGSHSGGIVENVSAVFMVIVMLTSLFYKSADDCNGDCKNNAKPNFIINITGMSCGNCSRAVQSAINELENVDSVVVNIEEKKATVYGEKVTIQEVIDAVKSLGYDASLIE